MPEVTISLPASLRDFVETQMRRHGYTSERADLESLVHRDRERAEKIDAMDARIEEGLNSGIGERSMAAVIAEGRQRAERRCTP